MGIFNTTTLTVLLICTFMAMMPGCRSDSKTDGSSGAVVVVLHGYMTRLEQVHDGRMVEFDRGAGKRRLNGIFPD